MEESARAYAQFFEQLDRDSLERIEQLCAPEVRFKDPFNDVTGVAAVRRVFEKMFEDVDDPAFEVTDIACSGQTAYLRWRFFFRPRKASRQWRIEGMSEVAFDTDGRVLSHIDHWDAAGQLYERLPIIGTLLRKIRRRLAA
ncbi:MAG: nuclear transport factor 2 family protein [Rhodovibrionaceae bacterium]|nr:nuclear transport factor 2 family protein [Rhodovibrionaceae bacterium]